MAKRKAIWTPKDYTQFFLIDEPTHTPKEIRAEYSRIRDITQKRAKRLEESGLKDIAQFLRKTMPKLSELKTIDEVKERLAQGYANYRTKAYSLKGIKELQKHLEDEAGERITLGDVLPFADYMRSWRLSAFKETVGSPQAQELYPYDYQEVGGTFADFYTLYKEEHGI